MTIKNITASVAAASLLSTAAFAAPGEGKVTYTGGMGESTSTYTIAAELLNHADQNATGVMQVGELQYKTGTIPNGVITEPAIVLKLSNGAVFNSNFADINVSDASSGDLLAVYKAGAGTSELALDPETSAALTSNMEINITSALGSILVPKGESSVTLDVIVGYSTDPSTADSGSAVLIDTLTQHSARVETPFDAKIDAAADFLVFTGPATSDAMTIDYTDNQADINLELGSVVLTEVVYFDQNTSAYVASAANTMGASTLTLNDMNVTTVGSLLPLGGGSTTTTLTVDGTDEPIKVTEFTVSSTIESTNIGTVTLLPESTDAGAWTIFGYNGQIPNVSTSPEVDTTLVFTNRSAIAADVYFTIIDADGNSDVVDSVNDGIAAIGVSETKKYKMSDLLAKTSGLSGNAFAVEVTIPTTPSSVYGYASFKNLTLGQFKDLPIYNSSEMTY
jgi:hypothetical protein